VFGPAWQTWTSLSTQVPPAFSMSVRRLGQDVSVRPRTRSASSGGEITFVGTATTVIKVAGFSILTDPNFLHRDERAYVGMGLRTRRLTDPALSIQELPPIDFVVLSHHHGDHFDQRAARDLDHGLPIVTEPHAARKLSTAVGAALRALDRN
jgi:L-ascorbate metabolism protein UlaG (beta-lactamase superfamily)